MERVTPPVRGALQIILHLSAGPERRRSAEIAGEPQGRIRVRGMPTVF
jgi:hypothetical protein